MFDKKTYIARREQLKKEFKTGLILLPANDEVSSNYPSNTYPFRQDSNFLYFFGLKEPNMVGLIDVDTDTDWLYADNLTMDDVIWMGHLPSVSEMASTVGITKTASISEMIDVLHKTILSNRKIHFVKPYRSRVALKMSSWLSIPVEELPNSQSEELIRAIIKQRSIKTKEEIVEIEEAMDIAYKMHTTAMKMCKAGTYEYEVAGAMQGIALSHNGGMSFLPIVSMNGQTLHNHNHSQKLREGRLVVTDAGAETFSHYCSDVTRTTPVGGKFNSRQKDMYEIVLRANVEVINTLKPGVPYRDYHLAACKIIVEGLKDLGLMKGDTESAVKNGAHALFMPHGLGHMMGLDVHDMENLGENLFGYDAEIKRSKQFGLAYLRLGRQLEPGFVLTVEPGMYFIPALIDMWKTKGKHTDFINYDKVESYKDFGGIRIEDDLLITDKGAKLLGKPIPKTVVEVEDFCL